MSRLVHQRALAALLLATAVAAPVLAAPQMPARKAGLWNVDMVGGPGGMVHMTVQSCADPAREKADAMFSSGSNSAHCEKGQIVPTPGGVTYHMICKPSPDMTTDTTGTATGDFQSGYVVRTTTKMTPAPMPSMAVMSMTMTARYGGACPADMKPGDNKVNGRLIRAQGG